MSSCRRADRDRVPVGEGQFQLQTGVGFVTDSGSPAWSTASGGWSP
jgi:hypothetical protein